MKADLLALVPNWGDIERNLDQKYSDLNQSVSNGLQSQRRLGRFHSEVQL